MSSEFELIEEYFAGIGWKADHVLIGPGDDCAVLRFASGCNHCLSVDTLIAGIHYPADAKGDVVATRSFAANMSDLAAMGAEPVGFLLALTLPEEDRQWLTDFSSTLARLSEQYQVPLVGGNLSRGNLSVTLTVIGQVVEGSALTRSGAEAGQGIYVTGVMGHAAGGLRLLQQGLPQDEELISAYYYPEPRLGIGRLLHGLASSCIDVSDGLIADFAHVCSTSNVGGLIELEALEWKRPVPGISRDDMFELSLRGGDDYELCFTAASEHHDAVMALSRTGVPITQIGQVIDQPGISLRSQDGTIRPAGTEGYQHF